jgi:outer membrane protein assembly factor BamB
VDTDSENRAFVLVVDPATGDVRHELTPRCTVWAYEYRPHLSDQFILAPDGQALYVLGSGSDACAWGFNPVDGTLLWTYNPPQGETVLPFSWSFGSLALGGDALYFVDSAHAPAAIYALDLATGAPRLLTTSDRYELTLQQVASGMLLLAARPDYDREQVELWGIDLATGERRWQKLLESTHVFDEWLVQPGETGLFLALCRWEEDECLFEVLDPQTGVSQAQVRQAVEGSLDGAAFSPDRAYLTIWGALYAVNLDDAQIEYTWP